MVFVVAAFLVVIVGILSMFIWNTETDIDTTKVSLWISEYDVKRQDVWWDKGKTSLEIDKSNGGKDNTTFYHYLLAIDQPEDFIGTEDTPITTNCVIKLNERSGGDYDGEFGEPHFSNKFVEVATSKDEFLECCRWTTDDYNSAMAFLQTYSQNTNSALAIFSMFREHSLKNDFLWIHNQTWDKPFVIEKTDKDGNKTYEYPSMWEYKYKKGGNKTETHYYFVGRKYSLDYLLENNIVKFDDSDTEKNQSDLELYQYIKIFGNSACANLESPITLDDDEKVQERIVKHYGKQKVITYIPAVERPNSDKTQYGQIHHSGNKEHYAIDLLANPGDKIIAPISGLCKINQREERGFEYVISTSYDGNNFDFTKEGYLIKISCSSASYKAINTPFMVTTGEWLGVPEENTKANYNVPRSDNDVENEDIFASYLFPCCTGTDYSSVGGDGYEQPDPQYAHIHMEMYKLPCDFNNVSSIKENVLNPELFFKIEEEEP